jgi:pimeloyl-ACP methyl ester carboxylesterase
MFKLLELLGTDTGLDADHLLVMFDALPDARTRHAFLRALRSAVDWRGQSITMLDRCYLASSIPTLLVWGARDAVIPFRQARIAHLAMPGSRLEVFERAGHFPHLTDSARFLSVIRDFLASTAPARYGPEEWRDALRRGRPETQT